MDQHLNIREFNPAAEQMFGYGRMDILGRNVEILLPPSGRAAARRRAAPVPRHRPRAAGRTPARDRSAVRADGTEFPVELTVARVGAESRASMTGFVRDITERRQLEEQLRQSQKLEAIGRLASGVAHDFNNILMSIMGSADLMLMRLDARRRRPRARRPRSSCRSQRGAGLTRQLLAFSRRQATRPRLFALGDSRRAAWRRCCAG